ncbi:MAG: nickel-dependent lactate racemase [Acetivibrionales bacterium]
MIIKIPYSKSYKELALDKERIKAVLSPRIEDYKISSTQQEIVKRALKNPIGTIELKHMAKSAKRALLITSDHTRPVPSKITLPLLLEEIRSENKNIEIKILIATGFHRATTQEELIYKFGREICEKEQIVIHDCRKSNNMVFKGILPSGGELWLNSLIDWADLVVSEGFIEPHFFAGFSGGRKSILPGIASEKSVLANHCSKFIASNCARTGILLGNPIHKDMLYAAEKADLAFILNVVIDSKKEIIKAFAGHHVKAHEKGCEFVSSLTSVKAVEADIVIVSNGGYPLDQNIYQAVKGMTAAEACVREGGVIIMVAACEDGHGGEEFYRWFASVSSPEEVAHKISTIPQDRTIADQWEAQILARILSKSNIIMVSDRCNEKYIRDMHMSYSPTLEQALETAKKKVGRNAGIVVIPDGVGIIIQK